jgi:hypothetical protein
VSSSLLRDDGPALSCRLLIVSFLETGHIIFILPMTHDSRGFYSFDFFSHSVLAFPKVHCHAESSGMSGDRLGSCDEEKFVETGLPIHHFWTISRDEFFF